MRALPTVLLTLFLAPSIAPRFEPMQPELFAAGGTLVDTWADFDGDGDVDRFVGFNGDANRLYRNDDGTFTDVAAAVGVADARATRSSAWGDYDGDGDPDLLVGFAPGDAPVLRLYRNDAGRFTDVTADAGLVVDSGAVRQPAWIDEDGDGDLDLFMAFRNRGNALFRNDGGRFRDVAAELGLADARRTVGALWLDADEDGDLDVVVANMDGDANGLFLNDGGHYTDGAAAAGIEWGGRAPADSTNGSVRPCAADVDGDGHLDLYFANYGPNGLFLNRGGGRFEDASEAWGVAIASFYDSCAFADFDGDGRVDLFVNGTVTHGESYRDWLMRNTGSGFEDVSPPELLAFETDHGVQWVDFDRDGDTDLALTGARPTGTHALLRNTLDPPAGHALAVRVVDAAGHATLAGAEVRIFAAGSTRALGTALVDAGSGYNAQTLLPVYFALPDGGRVDVEVTVPSGGRRAVTRREDVDPAALGGRALIIRIE